MLFSMGSAPLVGVGALESANSEGVYGANSSFVKISWSFGKLDTVACCKKKLISVNLS